MSNEELKPCPFCGNTSPEKTTWPYSPAKKLHSATVECCSASSRGEGGSRSIALRGAIKNWNTRALPPLPTEAVGNVEAIHYLHLYPQGEVFGRYEVDGVPYYLVKLNGSLIGVLDPLIDDKLKVTLVPRSEAPEGVIEAFEQLKGGE